MWPKEAQLAMCIGIRPSPHLSPQVTRGGEHAAAVPASLLLPLQPPASWPLPSRALAHAAAAPAHQCSRSHPAAPASTLQRPETHSSAGGRPALLRHHLQHQPRRHPGQYLHTPHWPECCCLPPVAPAAVPGTAGTAAGSGLPLRPCLPAAPALLRPGRALLHLAHAVPAAGVP